MSQIKISLRTKKNVVISLCPILAIALFVWYFFPVLMFNLFWYQNDIIRQWLDVHPISITELEDPPKEWTQIALGGLIIKLPLVKYSKVDGKETYIYFHSDKGTLLISDIVPLKEMRQKIEEKNLKYPVISYDDYLSVFCSTPADVSLFNTRRSNTLALQNQTLKAIAMPNGGLRNIFSVNTKDLKALCLLSEKGDKGYFAYTYLYSQNEEVCISLLLNNYVDKVSLNTDLFAVLGGVKMPSQMGDPDQISNDINRIVSRSNKT